MPPNVNFVREETKILFTVPSPSTRTESITWKTLKKYLIKELIRGDTALTRLTKEGERYLVYFWIFLSIYRITKDRYMNTVTM